MKKVFVFAGIVLLITLVLGFLVRFNQQYSLIINGNWSIKLPISYKEIYAIDDGPSFLGDGKRYHVLQYQESNKIIKSLDWDSGSNASMEIEVTKIIEELGASKEYIPDFKDSYKFYTILKTDGSKLYLIFYETTKRLYVVEKIF